MRESITTIAYLEDDPVQAAAVVKWLEKQNLQCCVFDTVDAMKVAIDANTYDVIILDVQIYGEDAGLEMLDYIRRTLCVVTPILMVSAQAYWREALSGGADDFLEKPLTSKKLLVHLRWLLRPIGQTSDIEDYPPYQLNKAQQKISISGNPVELSATEYELASTLFRYFGKVLSHSQLLEKISEQPANATTQMLDKDLHQLKRKMDLSGIEGWRLEPVYRHGYRLVSAECEQGC